MARDQQVRDAIDRFVARVHRHTEQELEALAADLLRVAGVDGQSTLVELERAAVDVARAVARGGAHARHDLITRVVTAVRRIDDATTLRGVLDALSQGASADATRLAVLLVDHDTLRGFAHHGFAPGFTPQDISFRSVPLLLSAIELRQVNTVLPEQAAADVPAFMRLGTGQIGTVAPLVVGGQVVALVYADGPGSTSGDADGGVWREQVEVLVRHASAKLESLTSQRTVAVLTSSS